MSSSPSYLDPVVLPLIVGRTVLDAGCGYGRWCHLIKANFWEAGLEAPPEVDGFDAFERNVELCRAEGCYRRVWQHVLPGPLSGSWDTVLACELIEHLAQEQVAGVIDALEHHATRRIIFTTPNWPYFRGGDDTKVGFNRFEAHNSYVPSSVFRERGYTLRGAGFGNPQKFLVKVGHRLGLAPTLHSVTRSLPSLAEQLVAYKDL